ncbi:MAG TPA: alkaline phosphatase family protein, partial [Acidimicrobiales bacterium]|nr:alkaline phosphatase family protein [Acidimicrobiales bacterium]
MSDGGPVLPDYAGACLSNVVTALDQPGRPAPWLPDPVRTARQVVLVLVDGLGWLQLAERRHLAPTLAGMAGGPITSVAPTTTATALSSLTLGAPPAAHGVVGYRVQVGEGSVLNVLRWRTAEGDARQLVPPAAFQPRPAFGGRGPVVTTRADFVASGFTLAHLAGTRIRGWKEPSAIAVEVAAALAEGEPFVYAYYDGLDKVAHDRGFGAYYDAELVHVDRLVADLAAALPPGAALVVTSDHGQVEVGDRLVPLPEDVVAPTALVSGEG